jgi:hypothetical protein
MNAFAIRATSGHGILAISAAGSDVTAVVGLLPKVIYRVVFLLCPTGDSYWGPENEKIATGLWATGQIQEFYSGWKLAARLS